MIHVSGYPYMLYLLHPSCRNASRVLLVLFLMVMWWGVAARGESLPAEVPLGLRSVLLPHGSQSGRSLQSCSPAVTGGKIFWPKYQTKWTVGGFGVEINGITCQFSRVHFFPFPDLIQFHGWNASISDAHLETAGPVIILTNANLLRCSRCSNYISCYPSCFSNVSYQAGKGLLNLSWL